jgi:hypothetical protein
MNEPIAQNTPIGLAGSLTASAIGAGANHVANSAVSLDIHDVATVITILSGSLSILMTFAIAVGWILHFFKTRN